MSWKDIPLAGAASIARVASVFEVNYPPMPGGRFKVKVLERGSDFLALPNVFVKKSDGTPDYISGLGDSETSAVADLMERFMPTLLPTLDEDAFEWSDPHDF